MADDEPILHDEACSNDTQNCHGRSELDNISFVLKDRYTWDYDLFISHSTNDSEEVREVCKELEESYRLKCALADRDFHPGVLVRENINDFIKVSHMVLMFITPDFLDSFWCYTEYLEALSHKHDKISSWEFTNIIPIVFKPLKNDVPSALSSYLKVTTYIDRAKEENLARKIFQVYRKAGKSCICLRVVRAPPSKMREPYSNHSVCLSVCLSVRPSVRPHFLVMR